MLRTTNAIDLSFTPSSTIDEDFQNRPRLRIVEPPPRGTPIFPGEAATQDMLERKNRRSDLIVLVQRFATEDFGWSFEHENTRLSHATMNAAIQFLSLLPMNQVEPKITPTGEGGLEVVWERSEVTAVVIEGWTLHAVKAAGTPQAEYIHDIPFTGNEVPPEILAAIPRLS
ncbi:MAG TPA: hypothetical protein VK138_13180 [Acidiferrobacterales bacterium]|nr:hypothetical protein [Acidiferrobacterales bacterium]